MEMYHILNRGTDKRNIVLNDTDRYRFMRDLHIFNDKKPAPLNPHRITSDNKRVFGKNRKPLLHIHAFCLIDNHYHLLFSDVVEGGFSTFMHKLNMGYSKYFNEKYKRVGTLWQGKYKKILIEKDSHYTYIPFYIHLNALDYKMKEWRNGDVESVVKALEILEAYRWSSHLDYVGIKNYPSIITTNLVAKMLGPPKKYKKEIQNLITNSNLSSFSAFIE